MLSNEKYIGEVQMQKTFTVDFLTGKRERNTGQLDSYLVEDAHEPIIDRKTFQLVQQMKGDIKKYRSGKAATRQNRNKQVGLERVYCSARRTFEDNNFANGHSGIALGSEMSGGIRSVLACGFNYRNTSIICPTFSSSGGSNRTPPQCSRPSTLQDN